MTTTTMEPPTAGPLELALLARIEAEGIRPGGVLFCSRNELATFFLEMGEGALPMRGRLHQTRPGEQCGELRKVRLIVAYPEPEEERAPVIAAEQRLDTLETSVAALGASVTGLDDKMGRILALLEGKGAN